jgi:hypothetical protein
VPADDPLPKGPPPAVWLPVVPQPLKRRRLALRRRAADPAAEFDAAMERAEADAAIKHRAVVQARRTEAPSVAHLARAADRQEKPARRPDDRDFLTLRIATADQPSRLRFEQAATTGDFDPAHTDRIAALRQRYATDPDVPVEADLRTLGALGAHGDEETRRAVLRSWVVQLATLAGPNDLALVVLATPEEAWPWSRPCCGSGGWAGTRSPSSSCPMSSFSCQTRIRYRPSRSPVSSRTARAGGSACSRRPRRLRSCRPGSWRSPATGSAPRSRTGSRTRWPPTATRPAGRHPGSPRSARSSASAGSRPRARS